MAGLTHALTFHHKSHENKATMASSFASFDEDDDEELHNIRKRQ